MDFSKLTPEQLLLILKRDAPDLYQGINTGYGYPENYGSIVKSLNKGYDPGLMNDVYNQHLNFALKQAEQPGYDPDYPRITPDEFTNYDYFVKGEATGYDFPYDEGLNPLGGGGINMDFPSDFPYEGAATPAMNSANAILANNRQIGDSDYTIDDLRANGMSDEQLLAFLRNLSNKGIKF